ncbi:MAG TPA: Nif3-like dinuclear metal center hexameric protein [Bacteroidales bacterium]|nr:Nif3-like dinuclear metal center hexameric protein [Bacteroidales bacterium]HOL98045.1 Nif3-like dinuclear metal center hexameric protein [Bacteroidales bacterium]HUM32421.1 Nif3-like dinuclear metal center hexameric protein [Bacteroidales bacterium]
MKVADIISLFDGVAPIKLQENFDNSGLNVGNPQTEIAGVLLCLDVIPEVVEEAIAEKCNLIISHHPLIFDGLKSITGKNYIEKSIALAIKNDISILCLHTNLDSVREGVSGKIADKLLLENKKVLVPKENSLRKLVVFVPESHAEEVRKSIFDAGAGHIGNYDSCSYNVNGLGSFRAGVDANPFVGEIGKIHYEPEIRVETIFPEYLQNKIISAMLSSHPYEEVAYDIYKLENKWNSVGFGIVGELSTKMEEKDFLLYIKEKLNVKYLRHSSFTNKTIKKVAVCGGSGASFIKEAITAGVDVYITGDVKYHDYFSIEKQFLLVDIGHYESEIFILEKFYDEIIKKNPNFAVRFTKINTNPINIF